MEDFTVVSFSNICLGVSSLPGFKWSFQLFGSVDAII